MYIIKFSVSNYVTYIDILLVSVYSNNRECDTNDLSFN